MEVCVHCKYRTICRRSIEMTGALDLFDINEHLQLETLLLKKLGEMDVLVKHECTSGGQPNLCRWVKFIQITQYCIGVVLFIKGNIKTG